MADEAKVSGVYCLHESGETSLVHAYTDEDYELFDIIELFAVGEMTSLDDAEGVVFTLPRTKLRPLKVQADAESFDHPEDFIEMCLDIYRFGHQTTEDPLRFVSVE